MAINQSKRAIGLFSSREAAKRSLYRFREAGLSLDKVHYER